MFRWLIYEKCIWLKSFDALRGYSVVCSVAYKYQFRFHIGIHRIRFQFRIHLEFIKLDSNLDSIEAKKNAIVQAKKADNFIK